MSSNFTSEPMSTPRPVLFRQFKVWSAWKEQIEILQNDPTAAQINLILSTMDAKSLFNTCLDSSRLYEFVEAHISAMQKSSVDEPDMEVDSAVEQSSPMSSAHLARMPVELTQRILSLLSFADKAVFALTCAGAAQLVGEDFFQQCRSLLKDFDLDFDMVRLMMTATGAVISGSTVPALLTDFLFEPHDLDFFCPAGFGQYVVPFLEQNRYEVEKCVRDYGKLPGIGIIWYLRHAGGRTVNVVESRTEDPLHAIARFHSSQVVGAISSCGVWHANPWLTFQLSALTTPTLTRLEPTAESQKHVWNILHKYESRGFEWSFKGFSAPHKCGSDTRCPATPRTSDDAGCLFIPFPKWTLSWDEAPQTATAWTAHGYGCEAGILNAGSGARHAEAFKNDNWELSMQMLLDEEEQPTHSNPLIEFHLNLA
ncbi:hypothetical protein R3P38DRAFT_3196015 [Favolaschia claudopus]|uniref:F-box domain-containing protein n=1 Tax=Favolaschia claudopus TaxID=2862362 RepID=A0AAW0BCN7_9AGAR